MRFDPTINLGNVLTALGVMFMFIKGYTSIMNRISSLEAQMNLVIREVFDGKSSKG